MRLALLDADIIAYRSAVAAQEDIDWGDGEEGLTVNTPAAIYNALSMTEHWLKLSGADKAMLCLSCEDGNYFRRSLSAEYKAERGGKPQAYSAVVEALSEKYEITMIPGLEADDVMGILGTSPKLDRPVIVSMDKDMKTVPAFVLNPLKDKKPKLIRPADADRFWMMQTLMGDRIDGYKGLDRVGPKTAERLLYGTRNVDQMWRIVVIEYEARGRTFDDALLNARLSRILRREDYDKKKEEIYLWHPKKDQRVPFDLKS